jgi:hypothetical protein
MTLDVLGETVSSENEGDDAPPAPRRHWGRWVLGALAFAIVSSGIGYVVGNEIQSTTQFDQTHASLNLTRHRNTVVLHNLALVRQDLRLVNSQVRHSGTALASDTTELQQVQAALAHSQANVSTQGAAIVALNACLSGVEQASNALSVGDQSSALNALDAVSSSCQSALVANG